MHVIYALHLGKKLRIFSG